MPVRHTILLGRESAGSRGGKRVAYCIKQVHPSTHQQNRFYQRLAYINQPQITGHNLRFGMNLVMRHAGSLRKEKLLAATTEKWKQRDGKQHNTQSSNPLRQAAPEQQPIG